MDPSDVGFVREFIDERGILGASNRCIIRLVRGSKLMKIRSSTHIKLLTEGAGDLLDTHKLNQAMKSKQHNQIQHNLCHNSHLPKLQLLKTLKITGKMNTFCQISPELIKDGIDFQLFLGATRFRNYD